MTLAEALEQEGSHFLDDLRRCARERGYLSPKQQAAAVKVAERLQIGKELARAPMRRETLSYSVETELARRLPPTPAVRYFQEIERAIAESRDRSIKLALEADPETGIVWCFGMPRRRIEGDLPAAWKLLDPEDVTLSRELYDRRIPISLIREAIEERGSEVIETEGPGGVLNSLRACRYEIERKWRELKASVGIGRWNDETFEWE